MISPDQPHLQGDLSSSGEAVRNHPLVAKLYSPSEAAGASSEHEHQQPLKGADFTSPLPSKVQEHKELERLLERAHAHLPSDLHSSTTTLSERILERISWQRIRKEGQARLERRLIETAYYQAAYDQAIQDAYKHGQIGDHTSDDELRNLGQQAGSRAVGDLTDPERPRGQLFVNRTPESLPSELKDAEELGIRPLKIDESAFKEEIYQWAMKEYDGQTQIQPWIWVETQNNEFLVLPHDVWSAEYEKFTSHTQLALGKPVKAAGQIDLAITKASEGGIHVEALYLSNMTGHYHADAASLYDCAPLLLEALRKVGITTENLEVEAFLQ